MLQRYLYRSSHTNFVSENDLDGVCFVQFIQEDDWDLINDHVLSVIGGLDCPIIGQFDQTLFNQ